MLVFEIDNFLVMAWVCVMTVHSGWCRVVYWEGSLVDVTNDLNSGSGLFIVTM